MYSKFSLIVCLFALQSQAASTRTVNASAVYVPVGYDSNDRRIVIVIEGYLPSSCHRITGARVHRKNSIFEVAPQMEMQGTDCEAGLKVPYLLEKTLNRGGPISAGNYEVHVPAVQGGMLKEPLIVKTAPVARPDSFDYAPVESADVGMLSGGRMRAEIEGRLQNTCYSVEIKLSTQNDKTYELLPLLRKGTKDKEGEPCQEREWRYQAHADFDEPAPGRYLLHVRTQDGWFLNRLFTNLW